MRKGERLAVAPGGSLAAIADSLGRVLLVDVNAVVVVRLWKVNATGSSVVFIYICDQHIVSHSILADLWVYTYCVHRECSLRITVLSCYYPIITPVR